nr:hypothetical protein HAGR004_39920 [Bdellovibrio sp. HAGR004]
MVYARLNRNAKEFATEGTKFWIETPKISIEGISGLGTLVEGSYIATLPGPDNAESVSEGDSVRCRGHVVGSVTKVSLSKTAQKAEIQLSLPYQHMRLIRTNTVFWKKQVCRPSSVYLIPKSK